MPRPEYLNSLEPKVLEYAYTASSRGYLTRLHRPKKEVSDYAKAYLVLNTMKKGRCKLCLENKFLCKESHIIPKFLYKLLFGKNNLLIFLDKAAARFRHNGEYEGGILCENCDNNIIGKLDDYAAKFIHSEFPKKLDSRIEIIDGHEHLVIENDPNYDYGKYKLFLLSLLWRASITSRPFFQQVKLSQEVEDDLRRMILVGEPGEPEKYASFVFLPPLVPAPGGGRGFNMLYMPTMSPMMAKTMHGNCVNLLLRE